MAKDGSWFRDRFMDKKRKKEQHAKTLPTDDDIPLPEPVDPIQATAGKINRNAPCPLGKTGPDGKVLKFKKCCGKAGHDHCVELEAQEKGKKK
jgi:hypothetical protein